MDDSYLIGSSTAYNRDRISHSHSFLLEAMAEVLVNPEMTNKRKGKKSEDGPRKNKIKKEPRGTIQGGTMCLEGLAQYEKDKVVLTEIPPEKDEKGEVTEVQVLETPVGEYFEMPPFDPDDFLEELNKHQPQSYKYQCPRCKVALRYGEITQTNGNTWRYYRCPTRSWDTKCYVTCSADEVDEYLKCVDKQTHVCYKGIPLARFRCECDLSLVLATSHSVNNPGRLYLKCPDRSCKFFQWINQVPRGMAKDILIDRNRVN